MGLKVFVFAAAVAATALNTAAQSLPEGPGKELVEAICTSCHTTERIVVQRMTKPQWADKVLEMLQEEPDVKQPERNKIVEYLAQTFPARVNVNKAAAKELGAVLDLSPENAAAIIRYRQEHGGFKTFEDLKKVPGLDAAKLDTKRESLDFKD
jgi:competence protein ComEA